MQSPRRLRLLIATAGILLTSIVDAKDRTPVADPADAPVYAEHLDLSYYLDRNGRKRAICTTADWKTCRGHILSNMQQIMGPLPKKGMRVPLTIKVVSVTRLGSLVRKKITFQSEKGDRVAAWLFLPAA